VRRGGEEPGPIAQLNLFVVPDLAVRMTGHNLKQVAIRTDGRLREMAELFAGHMSDLDFVMDSVDLDPDPLWPVPGRCIFRHVAPKVDCNHDTTPPRNFTPGDQCGMM
jgi:hypothetical protein